MKVIGLTPCRLQLQIVAIHEDDVGLLKRRKHGFIADAEIGAIRRFP